MADTVRLSEWQDTARSTRACLHGFIAKVNVRRLLLKFAFVQHRQLCHPLFERDAARLNGRYDGIECSDHLHAAGVFSIEWLCH